jgi:hypothetical protein
METKICNKCKTERNIQEFRFEKSRNYYLPYCRECERDYNRQYKEKNRERIRQINRNWEKQNRDKLREYRKLNRKKFSKRSIEVREAFSRRVHEYYGGHCAICGINEEYYEIYDAHHLDPTKKEYGISRLVYKDWDSVVVPELEKCVYLCKVCHPKLHKGRFDDSIKSGELILIPGRKGSCV